jgi:CO dehydrogenase nickel-insertion accessory protein CooC1
VDKLIVVVEPEEKGKQLSGLKKAQDIGLSQIVAVGNKIRNSADRNFLISNLPGLNFWVSFI